MLEWFALALSLGRAQTFDVYRPARPGPTVIFVHGGAWVSGDRAQYAPLGRAWAAAGLCTVVIDYHLAPEFKHPRPVEDLERARADFARAPGPRCDGARPVMIGHSAGAFTIASWAATHARGARGFVGIEGIYDLPKLAARWPLYPAQFLTAAFGPAPKWPAASPARAKLANTAPWLMIHSARDELVDRGQSDDFTRALRGQKIEVRTAPAGDETHFGVIERLGADTDLRRKVIEFVRASTR